MRKQQVIDGLRKRYLLPQAFLHCSLVRRDAIYGPHGESEGRESNKVRRRSICGLDYRRPQVAAAVVPAHDALPETEAPST